MRGVGQEATAHQALEQALKAARSIKAPSLQAESLWKIAEVLARAGRWEQYVEVARSIANASSQTGKDASYHAHALVKMAARPAEAGKWEQALVTACSIESPSAGAKALDDYVGAGQRGPGGACLGESLARSIKGEFRRTRALWTIVDALARNGQAEHARRAVSRPWRPPAPSKPPPFKPRRCGRSARPGSPR